MHLTVYFDYRIQRNGAVQLGMAHGSHQSMDLNPVMIDVLLEGTGLALGLVDWVSRAFVMLDALFPVSVRDNGRRATQS
jgi:hypothetical protein